MRIAIFSETYLPDVNGVATHIKTLKDGLEALGNEVLIVAADSNSRRHYVEKDVLHCPGITSKKLYNYCLASPVSLKRLRMLKKFNPDIIHIQNEFGVGLSGAFIAKILRKPLVYTIHTMYDDYIYYIAHKPFIKLMTGASHLYFKSIANHSSAVTGASTKIHDYLINCGFKKPVNIIPNAVELDIFNPDNINYDTVYQLKEKLGISPKDRVGCFCGRLGKEKSVDVLLDYWAEKLCNEDNLKLVIIGDGPEFEYLNQKKNELFLDDKVIFTGKIPHNELPPYYAMCDFYITASLSENYSISMLEALASGLAIIHAYDEKNEDQLIDGLNGFCFRNSDEMYDTVKYFIELSDEQLSKLKEDIRDTVKQSGAESLGKYIYEIYQNIYNKKKSKILD